MIQQNLLQIGILLAFFWLTGFFFDRARTNKKYRYPAHAVVELAMAYLWYLSGENWGWFILAANVGFLLMGFSQKTDTRPWYGLGDGEESTPEIICQFVTDTYNRWFNKEETMALVSVYVRLVSLVLAVVLLI